jgi:CBS domain-containing protein
MKVRDIMTTDVGCCHPDSNVAEAARIMWDRDCGVVPVVANEGQVVGMITDRDICMAVAMKGRAADRIAVREVSAGTVYSCRPDDDVSRVLETMKANQVRRVPVVDETGRLKGIVSLNDLALRLQGKKGIPQGQLIAALKAICERRHVPAGVV